MRLGKNIEAPCVYVHGIFSNASARAEIRRPASPQGGNEKHCYSSPADSAGGISRRRIKLFLFFFLCFFFFKTKVSGKENSFVTVVNPIRGNEFLQPKPNEPVGIKHQESLVDKENIKATWLIRSDAFEFSSVFKEGFQGHELGIFLEILPSLAKKAEVSYPQGGIFWHDANKIFLSGYKPEERIKLIDIIFKEFKEAFGFFPKSVGAWHVDAFSTEYMRRKYGVTGVLICADQFGTDGYQIWGGWWGVPYYPSRFNILTPAQTAKNKLDLVVYWWAARDPQLGYGGSVDESTFSVQVNDYQSHNLDIDYFKGLLDLYLKNENNQFSQVTVGLENDSSWEKIGDGFSQQLQEIARRRNLGELRVLTMAEFSDWYRGKFKNVSPEHQIGLWEMTPKFRIGLVERENGRYVRDLRFYNENWPEANLLTANPWGTLSLNNPYKIDTVRFEDSAIKADFEINPKNVIKRFGEQKIPFKISTMLLLSCYLAILIATILLIKDLKLLFLVLIGSVTISIPLVKSGLVYPFGMGFWGPNGHDGIWHLSLINQLTKFSLNHPTFSGAKLTNYHFGFDFLVAILSRLTGIIPVNMYFQILPPVLAISIGVLTYKFVEKWLGSKESAWWATFFVYFGGSWGWIVSLFKSGRLGGESTFWANQSISTLINPPYALSLILLLLGLIKFHDYLEKPNVKDLVISSILFGILIQIKVYIGIIIVGSLFLTLTFTLLLYRNKVKRLLFLMIGTIAVALLVFLPFNFNASSLLVFSPLWFPRTMLAFSDRLGWFKLENARQAYFATSNWLKWLLAEGLAITIFIVGNLGTRIIGFLGGSWITKLRRITTMEIFLILTTTLSLLFPLVFIQKGNPWNTIQFFYYFQFFLAIFAGLSLGKLWENSSNRLLVYLASAILVMLTVPTTVTTLKNDYLPSRPPARISIEELEALEFLSKQEDGVILTYPHNLEWWAKFSEPLPLYAYETTAYVSALSGKQIFLEDEMNLEISQYPWSLRKEEENRFFLTNDQSWARNFLVTNKIRFIYLVKGQKMNLGLNDIKGEKIFENGEVVLYEVH